MLCINLGIMLDFLLPHLVVVFADDDACGYIQYTIVWVLGAVYVFIIYRVCFP